MNRSQGGPDEAGWEFRKGKGGDFVLPVPGDTGKGFPEVEAVKLGLES